MIQISCVDDL